MKTQRLWTSALLGTALVSGAVTQTGASVVFVDEFDNGVATQVASESPNKWVFGDSGGAGENSTATEAGGLLTLTADRSVTNQPDANIAFQSVDNGLNFWINPITVTVSDVTRSGTGGLITAGQNFYFELMAKAVNPGSGGSSQAAAKIELNVFATRDNVRLGWSNSKASHVNSWNLIGSGASGSPSSLETSDSQNQTTGYILTLDGTGTQLTYELSTLYTGVNSKDTNLDGVMNSDDTFANASFLSGSLSEGDTTALRAQWLLDNGVVDVADAGAVLGLSARRTSGVIEHTAIVTIGSVQVDVIPEPATLGLLAAGGPMMVVRPRK